MGLMGTEQSEGETAPARSTVSAVKEKAHRRGRAFSS
jgi:hypothetical protein